MLLRTADLPLCAMEAKQPRMSSHELKARFLRAGVRPGSAVLLHSAGGRTFRELSCGPNDVLDGLLAAVGPEGTVLFPLFNFEFADGKTFDMLSSPSRMGSISEAARKHSKAVRTGHPIYSFAVIGARAHELKGLANRSGYGSDSPFGWLYENDGQIAVLDLDDQSSMTFYHHVEEMCEVPYRYHKVFTGRYIDAEGNDEVRDFTLFVRNVEKGVETSVNRMGELLWREGLYSGSRPRTGEGIRVINAKSLFERTRAIIDAGEAEEYLYEIR